VAAIAGDAASISPIRGRKRPGSLSPISGAALEAWPGRGRASHRRRWLDARRHAAVQRAKAAVDPERAGGEQRLPVVAGEDAARREGRGPPRVPDAQPRARDDHADRRDEPGRSAAAAAPRERALSARGLAGARLRRAAGGLGQAPDPRHAPGRRRCAERVDSLRAPQRRRGRPRRARRGLPRPGHAAVVAEGRRRARASPGGLHEPERAARDGARHHADARAAPAVRRGSGRALVLDGEGRRAARATAATRARGGRPARDRRRAPAAHPPVLGARHPARATRPARAAVQGRPRVRGERAARARRAAGERGRALPARARRGQAAVGRGRSRRRVPVRHAADGHRARRRDGRGEGRRGAVCAVASDLRARLDAEAGGRGRGERDR